MHRLIAIGAALLLACGGATNPAETACRAPACTPAVSSYAVELVGNAGSAFPATELTEVTLDGTSGMLALTIPSSATVNGHVTSAGTPVPASVEFTRPSAIAGRPDVSYEAPVSPADGSYSLALPPNAENETYTVRVRPTDSATYPPLTISASISGYTMLDLPLPVGDSLVHVRGTFVDAVSVGVSSATVVLRDATTLDDLSTTTTTDEHGRFDLAVSRQAATGANGILLVAQQGVAATGLLTLTQQLSATQLLASTADSAMALQLPALPPTTHLIFPVVGTGSSGTVEPVKGASFRVFAALSVFTSGVSIVHEVDGQTDDAGKITADLYSDAGGMRTYSVAIVPTADSEFESPQQALPVSVGTASGVGAQLTLTMRPLITGRVLDPMGTILKGATVQPGSSTLFSSKASRTLASPASASTDLDGRFALYLDPGTYDLAVSPPAKVSLPRTWLSRQAITVDLDLGDISLPSAVAFDVVLRDASAMPVQATVRLYTLPGSDPDCAGADAAPTGSSCVAEPQLQAEVATDSSGTASMLLPAQAKSDGGGI